MPDYCRNHRSHFCPCVAERLYRTPFVVKKQEWFLEQDRDEWDTYEKRYQEKNLEQWPVLRNPPSG